MYNLKHVLMLCARVATFFLKRALPEHLLDSSQLYACLLHQKYLIFFVFFDSVELVDIFLLSAVAHGPDASSMGAQHIFHIKYHLYSISTGEQIYDSGIALVDIKWAFQHALT